MCKRQVKVVGVMEEDKKMKQLKMFEEIGAKLKKGFSLKDFFLSVLLIAQEGFGFYNGAVLLEEDGKLRIAASIGYPKEELYLYADDHEWSYRITKSGGDICLVLDSLVDDIDTSWNVSQKKEKSFNIIANGSRFRMHYSTRNRVFFESKNLVSNRIIYKLNILFYSFLVKIADKSKQKQNYKIFKQAIFDGLKNKLGKNNFIIMQENQQQSCCGNC